MFDTALSEALEEPAPPTNAVAIANDAPEQSIDDCIVMNI
jgi:hypothetical protein